jgi:holin-like protein
MFNHVIYSIFAIALCLLVGKAIEYFLPTLPASLYGMMIFTAFLHYRILNAQRIKPFIEWALANMAVCFIPAGVGIINHFELLKRHGLVLVSIIFFTTFVLLTFVGLLYQRQLNKERAMINKDISN